MFNYLKTTTEKSFCFVCYFRKDRAERTEAFISFFDKYLKNNRIKKFFFVGHYVGKHNHDKIEFIVEKNSHNNILEYCKENNMILFTAVNGVNDYMFQMEKLLDN